LHRAHAARQLAEGGGELVVVEVENASKAPVAVALAVRPYTPEGLSVIERIDLQGATVGVDGRVALMLPRPPRRVAASTFHHGDSAPRQRPRRPGGGRCATGRGPGRLRLPLAHGATLRAIIRSSPEPPRRRDPRRLAGAPRSPCRRPVARAGRRRATGACAGLPTTG
jgi:hypothetical protein